MGIDCRIYLPDNVRIKDVADVLGRAAGCPLSTGYARVAGVAVLSIPDVPSAAEIQVAPAGGCVDGEPVHRVTYHFETDGRGRLLTPPSTPFWVAVARRLVGFFGGVVDYDDSDDCDVDFARPHRANRFNCPTDGEDWDSLQGRIAAVPPLSAGELAAAADLAAYTPSRPD